MEEISQTVVFYSILVPKSCYLFSGGAKGVPGVARAPPVRPGATPVHPLRTQTG